MRLSFTHRRTLGRRVPGRVALSKQRKITGRPVFSIAELIGTPIRMRSHRRRGGLKDIKAGGEYSPPAQSNQPGLSTLALARLAAIINMAWFVAVIVSTVLPSTAVAVAPSAMHAAVTR
jgi:hypothetical protein